MGGVSERGEYRSIRTVLIDGPDYQALSPEAKLVFLTLKLQLGPSGIGVLNGARYALADQTGYMPEVVGAALAELQESTWIRSERNVFEIVGGIDHEPSIQPTNINHRKSIVSHMAGLPNLPLVAAFRSSHPEWIGMASDTHADAIGDAMPITETDTEDGRRKTETDNGRLADRCDVSFPALLITRLNQGMIDNPEIGEAMNPVPHGHAPSVAAACEIEKSGVPQDFAAAFVYAAAKKYKPAGRNRQIKSLKYLTEGTIDSWEKSAARLAAVGTSRPAELNTAPAPKKPGWLVEKEQSDDDQAKNKNPDVQDVVRRASADNPVWWNQMQTEAKQADRWAIPYAYDQLTRSR